ncbi:MAG: hypothetical protein ACXVHQ_21100 [Solirubrobacteraceae bacterium]
MRNENGRALGARPPRKSAPGWLVRDEFLSARSLLDYLAVIRKVLGAGREVAGGAV